MQMVPSPSKPSQQLQRKSPIVSIQLAKMLQLFKVSLAHSSMSVWEDKENVINQPVNRKTQVELVVSLVQLKPSPSKPSSKYPSLQLHSKLPMASIQVCSQPPLLVAHSSISSQKTNKHGCLISFHPDY